MIRTQIQLTDEQVRNLKALASSKNVSMAELIRQSIDQMLSHPDFISLDERRRRAIAVAGQFSSGGTESDTSTNHDKYLAEAYGSW